MIIYLVYPGILEVISLDCNNYEIYSDYLGSGGTGLHTRPGRASVESLQHCMPNVDSRETVQTPDSRDMQ